MHRDVINFVVVTRYVGRSPLGFFSVQRGCGLKLRIRMFSQYGLCHHDVGRRPLEAVEEAGDGHRVCQALPCAHDAHTRCLCQCGRRAVREHR